MEMNKVEVAALEQADKDSNDTQSNDLSDLQLALVGGGIGSVIFG